jgi:hypothetical protein
MGSAAKTTPLPSIAAHANHRRQTRPRVNPTLSIIFITLVLGNIGYSPFTNKDSKPMFPRDYSEVKSVLQMGKYGGNTGVVL